MVDHENRDRAFLRFEPEAELLLDGGRSVGRAAGSEAASVVGRGAESGAQERTKSYFALSSVESVTGFANWPESISAS